MGHAFLFTDLNDGWFLIGTVSKISYEEKYDYHTESSEVSENYLLDVGSLLLRTVDTVVGDFPDA